MKTLTQLLLVATLCAAQTLTPTLTPTSVGPGGSTTLTLAFADATPSANVAGLQFLLTLPAGLTASGATIGAASTASGKVISCDPTNTICLVVGSSPTNLNANPFGSGTVLSIPISVAPAAKLGATPITLTNTAGSDASGNFLAMSTPALTLMVASKYDLNSDGLINSADIQLAVAAFTSKTCPPTFAAVGDGKCQVNDVVDVILAALGVIH